MGEFHAWQVKLGALPKPLMLGSVVFSKLQRVIDKDVVFSSVSAVGICQDIKNNLRMSVRQLVLVVFLNEHIIG